MPSSSPSRNWFEWQEESFRRRRTSGQSARDEERLVLTAAGCKQQVAAQASNRLATVHLGPEHFTTNNSSLPLSPLGHPNQISLEIQLCSSLKPTTGGRTNEAFEAFGEALPTRLFVANAANGRIREEDFFSNQQAIGKLAEPPTEKVMKLNANRDLSAPDEAWPRKFSLTEWDDFMSHINPIDASNWASTSLTGKVISIFRSPLLFMTILTVPVVDNEKPKHNWCRLLNSIHCFLVPAALLVSSRWAFDDACYLLCGMPFKLLILLPGLCLALFVFKTTNAHRPPTYHAAFAYVGFVMSVVWVYLLATEIISLLKTVGIIFSMTDTAIGLGVLAWGNSLGDIVANLSLADAGYPRMALGASIGAPLLNLLLGFGLSFTISLRPGESSPIDYSPTITLLCSTLAAILVALMLSTLVPHKRSKKPFGYLLILAYAVYFALALCIECGFLVF